MPERIALDEVAALLRPGMTVFVEGASGEPTPVLQALARAPAASAGVHYVGCRIPGLNVIDPASFHPEAGLTCFFVSGANARSHAAGRVRFLPLYYGGMWQYLSGLTIDLALIQASPPDAQDRCSLGVSVHFVPAVLERARLVVAEINAAMPAPARSYQVPYRRLDYVVATERPLLTVPGGALPDEVRRIGRHVASLVDDGDTIQIGIGKMPAAVLGALGDHRDLGLHAGLVADEVADLHEAGVMTGARKSSCAALGRRRSILALPSTAAGGKTSRIVPRFGADDVVSCPRADADIVVFRPRRPEPAEALAGARYPVQWMAVQAKDRAAWSTAACHSDCDISRYGTSATDALQRTTSGSRSRNGEACPQLGLVAVLPDEG